VEISSHINVFAGAKVEASASEFGILGVTIKAIKPIDD